MEWKSAIHQHNIFTKHFNISHDRENMNIVKFVQMKIKFHELWEIRMEVRSQILPNVKITNTI